MLHLPPALELLVRKLRRDIHALRLQGLDQDRERQAFAELVRDRERLGGRRVAGGQVNLLLQGVRLNRDERRALSLDADLLVARTARERDRPTVGGRLGRREADGHRHALPGVEHEPSAVREGEHATTFKLEASHLKDIVVTVVEDRERVRRARAREDTAKVERILRDADGWLPIHGQRDRELLRRRARIVALNLDVGEVIKSTRQVQHAFFLEGRLVREGDLVGLAFRHLALRRLRGKPLAGRADRRRDPAKLIRAAR